MEPPKFTDENGLVLDFYEKVFAHPDSIFEQLEREIEYLPESRITMHGRSYLIPRQHAAYGNDGLSYTFSGLTLHAKKWTPLLLDIKSSIESLTGASYNFVLINRYRNNRDCIGEHKDNEAALVKNSPISCVSFGDEREIVFSRAGYESSAFQMKHGSLMVMRPPTNSLWSHSVPRCEEEKGVRVSLTFRNMKTAKKRASDTGNNPAKRVKKCGLKMDSLPPHHYHLGQHVFAVVSSFKNEVKLHLRAYSSDEFGDLQPTQTGVTLQPKTWFSLIANLSEDCYRLVKTFVAERELFCVKDEDEGGLQIQKMMCKKDGAFYFLPNVLKLTLDHVYQLRKHAADITKSFGHVVLTSALPNSIKEVVKTLPEKEIPDAEDAEMVLSTALSEILAREVSSHINELFSCFGCEQNYANQLGHDCMRTSHRGKFADCGNKAICMLDTGKIAAALCEEHRDILRAVQDNFFQFETLFENIEKAYISMDNTPLYMYDY